LNSTVSPAVWQLVSEQGGKIAGDENNFSFIAFEHTGR
jgi:hypothetical protein